MDLHAETSHLCDEFQNLIDSNRISESIFALEHKATVILNLLAVAYSSRLKDQIKSKKCLELLLEIDPTNVSGCSNLSHITNISGFFEEALKYSERSIVYSKGASYEGFYNRGVILLALGRTKEATAMFEKALELDPKNPSANYNIGLSLLKSEICQRGWQQYEWRFQTNEVCKIFMSRCKSVWNGEDINGKTLFIFNEQGFGDFIFFSRFIPEVRKLGCKIFCEVQESLIPIVQGLLYKNEILPRRDSGLLENLPENDYEISICSIPKVLKIDDESKIPKNYLLEHSTGTKPDIFLKNKINVGMCWFGNPSHVKDAVRSTAVSNFKCILDIPEVGFFGLGKNGDKIRTWPDGQVNLNRNIESLNITNLDSQIKNFGDLRDFIVHLDLVISVDTSVVHLAASLGKKTWLILGKESDFRWQENREDSPWYPTLKIFRFDETWEKTILNVKKAFLDFLHSEF